MQPKALIASLAVVSAVAVASLNLPDLSNDALPGDKAPDFSAKLSTGKDVTLKSLLAKGPVYLYFVKSDCPINARALPYYQKISAAYGEKSALLGVINEDSAAFKSWNAENKTTFRMALDPQAKIINSYGAERSPWIVEVRADGKIGKVWQGYSQGMLSELNNALALSAKMKPAAINVTDAPKSVRYG